jgi:hypothetical protein
VPEPLKSRPAGCWATGCFENWKMELCWPQRMVPRGYEKGAFTDARTQKRGILELASGGTAFLDEVGELPLSLQAKLLRVLEEHRFRRLGGTKDVDVDLRVIAATNQELRKSDRTRQIPPRFVLQAECHSSGDNSTARAQGGHPSVGALFCGLVQPQVRPRR